MAAIALNSLNQSAADPATLGAQFLPLDPGAVNDAIPAFFIGRNSVRASADEGMPLWQDQIFLFLQHNASDPTDFFHIPPNRVVELGMQVVV